MSRSKPRFAPIAIGVPDSAFARTLSRIKRMTKQQMFQSLRDAGILTAKGNYTKPYRMLRHQ
jgi:hypothetical protein